MKPSELIAEFRNQVQDNEPAELWSDDEVHHYMVLAQDMFVRLTGGIRDASTREITDIPVITGQAFAAISPYILDVRNAALTSNGSEVVFLKEQDLETERFYDYGFPKPLMLDEESAGTVSHAITGLTDGKVRWYLVPTEDDVCRVRVTRLPYPRLKLGSNSVPLEIQEQHHWYLLLWMKHLAYSKEDDETFNMRLRDDSRRAFEDYCLRATAEISRLRARPRQVKYGGP